MKATKTRMFKSFLRICFLAFCSLIFTLPVLASGIVNSGKRVDVNYWTCHNKNGDEIILDAKDIAAYNERIHDISSNITNFLAFPRAISKKELSMMVNKDYILKHDLYVDGKLMSDEQKALLCQQASVGGMGEYREVGYAVTVNRAALRVSPSNLSAFNDPHDKDFDAFLEVIIDPAEPLIVLHESGNGDFYFVLSIIGTGWISKDDIAMAPRSTWLTYVNPENFLVVVGRDIKLKNAGRDVLYQQGARLPFMQKYGNEYKVLAPVRAKDGSLVPTPIRLRANAAVHEGYQPYTSNNIITAAFKFYGEPYGWGGLKDSVDCSALLYNAYRTVGILLPRNGELQMNTAGSSIRFDDLHDRRLAFANATPGMAVFFYEGDHVMIYLGKYKDKPYFLHALSAHVKNGKRINEMRVLVSDATLKRGNGRTYLDNFDRITAYK